MTSTHAQSSDPTPANTSSTPAATPAAAPRRRDPEGRRRAILDAATALVVERGVAALTHRAIAARAEVPLGSTTQHFASIDELREAALQQLADEIDEALESIEPFVADMTKDPSSAVTEILAFLGDRRAVQAEIALITSGTTDPRLRALATRWNDRLIEMLTEHIGRAAALALSVYLDGATVHASLRDEPLTRDDLTRAFLALSQLPEAPSFPTESAAPTAAAPAPEAVPELRRTSGPAHS